jgi:hypothetical protein
MLPGINEFLVDKSCDTNATVFRKRSFQLNQPKYICHDEETPPTGVTSSSVACVGSKTPNLPQPATINWRVLFPRLSCRYRQLLYFNLIETRLCVHRHGSRTTRLLHRCVAAGESEFDLGDHCHTTSRLLVVYT